MEKKDDDYIKYGITDIHYNNDKSASCWNAGVHYRIQTKNIEIAARIKKWTFAWLTASAIGGNWPWIFCIPLDNKKLNWACQQLGLPIPSKSPGRVKYGKARARILNSKPNKPSPAQQKSH